MQSIHCRGCGYDLRTLSPSGRCPECGLPVWETVLHTVDPAASRLPKLRNPRAVGNGLLWIMMCSFAAMLLLAINAIGQWWLTRSPGAANWSPLLNSLQLVGGVIAFSSVIGAWLLKPTRGRGPIAVVRREVGWIAFGAAMFGALILLRWSLEQSTRGGAQGLTGPTYVSLRGAIHLGMAMNAVLVLSGMDGVLQAIGKRSRAYRNAAGGRQSAQVMVAATSGAAVGIVLRLVGGVMFRWEGVYVIGTLILWSCVGLLVMGMAYLVVNAWWIRRSILRPPPRLEEVVADAGQA